MKLLIYRLITGFMTILCLAFVIYNSAKTGEKSAETSKNVTEIVATVIVPGFKDMSEPQKEAEVRRIHPTLREIAHSLEFCALSFFLLLFLVSFDFRVPKYYTALFSIALCFLVALSDEFILQKFIRGRGSEWLDVGMDALGATVGSMVATAGYYIVKNIKNTRKKNIE